MMVSVRLSEAQVRALDHAVGQGRYETRTEALRALVDRFAREERERELAERFRRAYAAAASDDERGLHAFSEAAALRLFDGAG
jgi:Arc/MetJ-type ribon-helix-helix transcriptional regulator